MDEHTVGREPVTYVEIDQDFIIPGENEVCLLADRITPGYNTLATCAGLENYTMSKLTLTFCKPEQDIPAGLYAIPSVMSVSTAPTVLNPSGGGKRSGPLGIRASVKVTFQDHPSTDNLVDPYLDQRDYDPLTRGTFWSKWIARNPYYTDRVIRIREGYKGQSLEDMITRTYLIDKIAGPDAGGKVTITAKDVLKLADDDKTQAPHPSTGELIVAYSKDDAISTLRVTGADAADYPAPGTVRINREVMTYSGVTTIGVDEINLTGVARATDGSEVRSHKEGDRVQLCLRYTDIRVDRLAYEWLTVYGNIDPAWIPQDDWEAEAEVWLEQFELSGLITEPTGISTLLAEITEQCLFYIWWDERTQRIELEATKPAPDESVTSLDDGRNILADSVRIKDDPSSRVSQIWVFWTQKDPTEKLDDEGNYSKLRVRADLDKESDDQYGSQRIRKIFSRWLQNDGQTINVSTRLLNRFRSMPKRMTLDVDAKDRALWTGDVADITHHGVTDFSGLPQTLRWQVLSAEEVSAGHIVQYEVELYEYGIGVPSGRWMTEDAPIYGDADDEEKKAGAWWADEGGKIDDDLGYFWT